MQKFTIELSEQEVNAVMEALSERPYKIIAPLVANIYNQAQAQIAAMNNKTEYKIEVPPNGL